MLIYFDLTVNLVGGANVVCFVSLLIHIAIHTSLEASQISKEQGSWLIQVRTHWWRDARTSLPHCLVMCNTALPIFCLHKIILILQKFQSTKQSLWLKNPTTIILKSFYDNKNSIIFDFNDEPRPVYRVSILAHCSILVMKAPASLFSCAFPSCYYTVFGYTPVTLTQASPCRCPIPLDPGNDPLCFHRQLGLHFGIILPCLLQKRNTNA